MIAAEFPIKHAIIVGSSGQVARALRAALPKFGFEVTTLARPAFDLLSPSSLAEAIERAQPDIVINAAAYTAVDRAEDEPELAHAINGVAPGIIARAAANAGCPIVHFSTDYVFNGEKTLPYLETDDVAPLGVYGASKLAGEAAVVLANRRSIVLRTAWVCSPHGQNFVRTMLKLGRERAVLRVVNDQFGCPIFADDIACAVGIVATTVARNNLAHDANQIGVFNLAGTGTITWYDFARAIMAGARQRGHTMADIEPIPSSSYPTKARRPAYSKLDTTKIERMYGIGPVPWAVGLDQCLDVLIGPTI
jgi:dTDP-4-dehydrorhamnose reductase